MLDLGAYLSELRSLVLEQIRAIIPRDHRLGPVLYDLMLDYPLRAAKGLRPALCVATCCALGGSLRAALRSSAVLELYHNAFLIHDDVEDGSDLRRDGPTLHEIRGVPVAVNVGDAMLALAMEPLLDNVRDLGVGKALRIMQVIARMARESAEGQAMELDWIARRRRDVGEVDYVRMVHKKSGWYTFVAPMLIGAIVAGVLPGELHRIGRIAVPLGVAFQIQDDLLNLVGDPGRTGKRRWSDLWEGKYTLMLLHVLRAAPPDDRRRIERVLSGRGARGPSSSPAVDTGGRDRIRLLVRAEEQGGAIGGELADALVALLAGEPGGRGGLDEGPDEEGAEFILHTMERVGSIDRARRIAGRHASRASRALAAYAPLRGTSDHHLFLEEIMKYVVSRPE